jgi:DNA-binding NtrC family response regulator
VGGRKPVRIDIRVLATTNRDLRQMISTGAFREDLFYRLNVIPLRLPPLRERLEDIEHIARAFLNRAGYRKVALTAESVQALLLHTWPGNVRELCNVLERAAIMAGGEVIRPEHLLLEEEPLATMTRVQSLASSVQNITPRLPSPTPSDARPQTLDPRLDDERIRAGLSVQELEERLIQKTLSEVNDNRTQAAKLLGISVRTLRNKLKQYQKVSVA